MPGQKEQAVLDMVKQTTPSGNPQAVLDAMDKFAWSKQGFLMNIGDVKGVILDSVIDQYQPVVRVHSCMQHTCQILWLENTDPKAVESNGQHAGYCIAV